MSSVLLQNVIFNEKQMLNVTKTLKNTKLSLSDETSVWQFTASIAALTNASILPTCSYHPPERQTPGHVCGAGQQLLPRRLWAGGQGGTGAS